MCSLGGRKRAGSAGAVSEARRIGRGGVGSAPDRPGGVGSAPDRLGGTRRAAQDPVQECSLGGKTPGSGAGVFAGRSEARRIGRVVSEARRIGWGGVGNAPDRPGGVKSGPQKGPTRAKVTIS